MFWTQLFLLYMYCISFQREQKHYYYNYYDVKYKYFDSDIANFVMFITEQPGSVGRVCSGRGPGQPHAQ